MEISLNVEHIIRSIMIIHFCKLKSIFYISHL